VLAKVLLQLRGVQATRSVAKLMLTLAEDGESYLPSCSFANWSLYNFSNCATLA
jgi:hypothetical protein